MGPERSAPASETKTARESAPPELTERDLDHVAGGYNPKELGVDMAKWELPDYDSTKNELKIK